VPGRPARLADPEFGFAARTHRDESQTGALPSSSAACTRELRAPHSERARYAAVAWRTAAVQRTRFIHLPAGLRSVSDQMPRSLCRPHPRRSGRRRTRPPRAIEHETADVREVHPPPACRGQRCLCGPPEPARPDPSDQMPPSLVGVQARAGQAGEECRPPRAVDHGIVEVEKLPPRPRRGQRCLRAPGPAHPIPPTDAVGWLASTPTPVRSAKNAARPAPLSTGLPEVEKFTRRRARSRRCPGGPPRPARPILRPDALVVGAVHARAGEEA